MVVKGEGMCARESPDIKITEETVFAQLQWTTDKLGTWLELDAAAVVEQRSSLFHVPSAWPSLCLPPPSHLEYLLIFARHDLYS